MPGPGYATYPGLNAIESINWTDQSGIQPSTIQIRYNATSGEPLPFGSVQLYYNNFFLNIGGCHLVSSKFCAGTGGTVKTAIIQDERWKWKFRSITGYYNIRLPNNFVDPAHQQTPQQLATLCFNQLNVIQFDVSALPNLPRPEVNWDRRNAAEALDEICQLLGCRIVCQRSTGIWKVVVSGVGGPLPNWPLTETGGNLERKLIPDFIKIVTAPIQFQFPVSLEPIGKDIDMSWGRLAELTYTPVKGNPTAAFGFGYDPSFAPPNISAVRALQGDGTRISPHELATQYIFQTWRMQRNQIFPWTVQAPQAGNTQVSVTAGATQINRKQILLSDQLAQIYKDTFGAEHGRPAFAYGSFWDKLNGNTPFPTRVDYQGQVYKENPDSPISVSLSINEIDPDRSILTFSQQMLFYVTLPGGAYFESAKQLQYFSACQIRDPVTWQPYRYEYLMPVGGGGDVTNCLTVMKEDLQPWFVSDYTARKTTDNSGEMIVQSYFYALAIKATLIDVPSQTDAPVGWFYCDMDGAITEVTYTSDSSGTSMKASLNTEHSFYLPTAEERRQQEGRKNAAAKLHLLAYIAARQAKARGTWNT